MRAAIAAFCVAAMPMTAMTAEKTLTCLSNDGQVRVSFIADQVDTVAVRVPARGNREARLWRMSPDEYVFSLISQSGATPYPEGCDGVAAGTIAVVRTEYLSTRRVRLILQGGAFPEGISGRLPDGDGLERDLTCKEVKTAMAKCP